MIKAIDRVLPPANRHWVGDGFPVRTLFSVHESGGDLSPFILLDYAGPAPFPPSSRPRGVGQHPHKGFETVTIVYQGELEHRDSGGNHGSIGRGDVQWMTAASGVVHEEKHSRRFTEQGGTLEMVQLWVNLPAHDKAGPPGYQTLIDRNIPVVQLKGGRVRVIAGDLRGVKGPARTFTPMNVWDVKLETGADVELEVPREYTTAVIVLHGRVRLNADQSAGEAQVVVFDRNGDRIGLQGQEDATLLLLNGKPIDEPVVAYGPFVMNTNVEIQQAIREFESGRMGHIDA